MTTLNEIADGYVSAEDENFDPTKDTDKKAAAELGFIEGKEPKERKEGKGKKKSSSKSKSKKRKHPEPKLSVEERELLWQKWNIGVKREPIQFNPIIKKRKLPLWYEVPLEERKKRLAQIKRPDPSKKIETIVVTEKKQFAGETIEVKKVVEKNSKKAQQFMQSMIRRSNVDYVLEILAQKKNLTAVDKSRLDWEKDKEEKGDQDKLTLHTKGKEAYISKTRFLNRVAGNEWANRKAAKSGNGKRKRPRY